MEGATASPRLAAIVNHRRHDEAIFERETSNRKRLEKSWPRFAAVSRSVGHWSLLEPRVLPLSAKSALLTLSPNRGRALFRIRVFALALPIDPHGKAFDEPRY